MGPTGVRTVPTASRPSQAPTRATAPRAAARANGCAPSRCGRGGARGGRGPYGQAGEPAAYGAGETVGEVVQGACDAPVRDTDDGSGHWGGMPAPSRGLCPYPAGIHDNGGVLEMTREEFEELVAEALDRIPRS